MLIESMSRYEHWKKKSTISNGFCTFNPTSRKGKWFFVLQIAILSFTPLLILVVQNSIHFNNQVAQQEQNLEKAKLVRFTLTLVTRQDKKDASLLSFFGHFRWTRWRTWSFLSMIFKLKEPPFVLRYSWALSVKTVGTLRRTFLNQIIPWWTSNGGPLVMKRSCPRNWGSRFDWTIFGL